MVGEMKNSFSTVAGLIVITTSLLTGCSSTSNPAPSTSSQGQTSTESSSVQTPTSAAKQATSSTAPTTGANTSVASCQTQYLSLTQGRVGAAAGSTYVTYYLKNHGQAPARWSDTPVSPCCSPTGQSSNIPLHEIARHIARCNSSRGNGPSSLSAPSTDPSQAPDAQPVGRQPKCRSTHPARLRRSESPAPLLRVT